ncbi:nitrous oxide-stimulated promoter family protein [Paenibacillus alvei]|uniref:nitrous oxide-stimulated promoter family protein n=2 Tax=Paenibacillus alvei TaxID=44250 RepID=UPI002A4E2B27|nr:nitrous oxide-stimulated promoter family protein [Paenibacillus alvei]
MLRSIKMTKHHQPQESMPLPPVPHTAHDSTEGPRIRREKRTVLLMIRIYCRNHHLSEMPHHENGDHGQCGLCPNCDELLAYAWKRLTHCRFGESKTTCERCTVHCYKPDKRDAIQRVMREVGPKMLYKHPIVALRHAWDHFRPPK